MLVAPWFWLRGTRSWRGRAAAALATSAAGVGATALLLAPFWRGPATLLEPLRALWSMNPGGSIVDVAGVAVLLFKGGAPASPQLPVAADLAGAGIVDHHLTWPHRLQSASVTVVQRGEVLPHRIGSASRASLLAHQFYGTGEVRKPWHRDPYPSPDSAGSCRSQVAMARPISAPESSWMK